MKKLRPRAGRGGAARLTPVPDRPVLELVPPGSGARPFLLLADVHLGLGSDERSGGIPPEGLARAMALDLVELLEERRAQGVVLLGDAKHPIVGTPSRLRRVVFDFFATLLGAGASVELVLGNHDVGIERYLPREVTVHGAEGLVRHGIGMFHGHRWPSAPVLEAARLVTGHLHPGFRFAPTADAPSAKERCWVRVAYAHPPPGPRPAGRRPPIRARELIVLPAFNPIAGTESLNRERPARGRSFLFARFLAGRDARAYLLDGTDLGPILTASNSAPRGAGPGTVPRAR